MIRLSNSAGQQVLELLSEGTWPEIVAIRAIVREQLDAPQHDHDLTEAIASVLMDPNIHRIDGDILEALRRAILSPLELVNLNALRKKPMSCHGCGSRLFDYDVVTIQRKMMFCWYCVRPEHVTCRGCRDHLDMTGTRKVFERAVAKHICHTPPAVVDDLEAQLDSPAFARPESPTEGGIRPVLNRREPVTATSQEVEVQFNGNIMTMTNDQLQRRWRSSIRSQPATAPPRPLGLQHGTATTIGDPAQVPLDVRNDDGSPF